MSQHRLHWIAPLLLAFAWLPALYVAWRVCPAWIRMFKEFELSIDPLTVLLLVHAWWLTPLAMLATIALAFWQRTAATIYVGVAGAMMAAVCPVALALWYLNGLVMELR